ASASVSGAVKPGSPDVYPKSTSPSRATENDPESVDSSAAVLRSALNAWVSATNNRDINRQMSFYVARLKRYYLMNNASQNFVREEKARVFSAASLIDIRAEEPEIVFQDGGRTAIMRYRKQ